MEVRKLYCLPLRINNIWRSRPKIYQCLSLFLSVFVHATQHKGLVFKGILVYIYDINSLCHACKETCDILLISCYDYWHISHIVSLVKSNKRICPYCSRRFRYLLKIIIPLKSRLNCYFKAFSSKWNYSRFNISCLASDRTERYPNCDHPSFFPFCFFGKIFHYASHPHSSDTTVYCNFKKLISVEDNLSHPKYKWFFVNLSALLEVLFVAPFFWIPLKKLLLFLV